jgi:membrane-bound serine protease (ClpP class)
LKNGRFLLLILALAARATTTAAPPTAIAVEVTGMVHPVTAEMVGAAIDEANREGAAAVIVRLNTPGGLMDAMRSTIERIVASRVPVITYVCPSGGRSASAGFFLLEAGDVAAMAPGTNTGAAHPVALAGEMDEVTKKKVENDAAAYLRSIASRRGRNSELAETAVRESRSFTEREALDQHLIEITASSERELLDALDGRVITRFDGRQETLHTRGAQVKVYEASWRQRIMRSIADPNIALALLIVGALAIYLEFHAPGMVLPGVVGAILVLLGLAALSVMPINWMGVALIVLALSLFIMEAKFASHGVLGGGGAVAMLLGAMILIDSPVPEMRIRWTMAVALVVPFSVITVLLTTLAVRARRAKVETGGAGMIGQTGSAVTELTPEGTVLVHGEYWSAVSSVPLAAGAAVRVVAIDKLKVIVEPISQSQGD